jgi:hypothetical protein
MQRRTLANFCKISDLKKQKPPLQQLQLLEVPQPPLLVEREIFKLLQLLPLALLNQLLLPQQLPLQNFLNCRKPHTLLSLETNKDIEYQVTIFHQSYVIKQNNLNCSLKKLNLPRSCNKEYN